MTKLSLILMVTLVLMLVCPCVQAAEQDTRTGGVEEFNNFKHFDRKENIIHAFSEFIFGPHLPENPAIVKSGQIVRWGWEHTQPSLEVDEELEEEFRAVIDDLSQKTVFTIDGEAVEGWYYTEPYFFESFDHDGDGPGDGDGDGIGDIEPSYLSAFRYSTYLSVGTHEWSYESLWFDSGTVIVLP